MEGLTRFVLRHRWPVLAVWLVAFGLCAAASLQLSERLTNRFTLPGTDTRRAEELLEEHFGQRSTGSFTLVARVEGNGDGNTAALVPRLRAAAERAVAELPTGRLATGRNRARAARAERDGDLRQMELVAAGGGARGSSAPSPPRSASTAREMVTSRRSTAVSITACSRRA